MQSNWNLSHSLQTLFLVGLSLFVQTSIADENATKADSGAIKIGLLPYLSPDLLMSRYAPLIEYLGKELDLKPIPETAPNFPTYVKRASKHKYDLYVTAPHFAALAEKKHGYKRIAKLTRELDGAMIVRRDSDLTSIEQLSGKKLATPDRLAIITILGELALQKHGIEPSKDLQIVSAPSHNTALLEVIAKRADAAVVSAAVYESMKPHLKRQLRLIFSTQKVPHMMFLANPNISDSQYDQLKDAVLKYTAKGAGKDFFKESGYIDIAPITDNDMAKMKAMLPLLEPRLK